MRMILLGLLAASVFPLQAKVKLPGFFSDNMVLQREAPVKIWGWADKNEPVQVRFNGQVKETKAPIWNGLSPTLPGLTKR